MDTFRFFQFQVYNDAKDLYKKVLIASEKIKNNNSLKDQTTRSALSIILNIAEGSAKKSDKDFARYLQISLGSVNELVACLNLIYNIGYLDKILYVELFKSSELVAKQLGGFIKKLNNVNS
ncbi:MAG: four helix bundle protein [Candidatus Buchananbacteria bacterium]|nr:four helix bundle protein [Candidatus Buchananbacteria bacterium]